ncbi:MAG: pyridoxal phosphate-dependent aminotransferase, partial [Oscillospiraceae bacterium]
AAQVGAENVFDFSIGNPSVPAPQCVADAARELLEGDPIALHGYTSAQGDATVRTVITEHLNERFNTSYRPEHLYMTVGAAAALCCCFHGLTCPGDEYICFAPYFPEYGVFIRGAGAKMVVIPAEIEAFQIDFDAFEAAINEHTKGVVVNSPNNPCGAVYSAETVQRLADILRAKSAQYGHPIYLISDEPYREIVYGVTVPWLPNFYDNTLVCYSYSKSLSLPGERIGYVLVPPAVEDHDTVYAAVAGAGRKLGYVCAPSLFQYVIARCDGQTADLSVYKRNKELLVKSLREMGYHCVEPGGTFYLFPRTLEPDDMAFSERAKKYDLLLVPGSGFGCPGHVRLSFCVPTERIERSLPAFEKLIKEYR